MEKIKILILVVPLFLISLHLHAQTKVDRQGPNKKITGVIIDSLTNKPIEFGNFVLYRTVDSSVVHGSVSDKDGRFTIDNVPFGRYYASISFIGYKTRRRSKIEITPSSPSVLDFDTIKLSPRSVTLSEVQVVAEKNRITREEDKIILKVDKTIGVNALDALESAPMVNVDIDGSVSLMGKRGTVLYIDGKPASYLGINSADDLKMLGVNEIEKIELLPDPPIEYDERTQGGIINIITKKTPPARYTASTTLGMNTNNNLHSNSSLQYGKGDISINGKYSNEYSSENSGSDIFKTITLSGVNSYLNQTNESKTNSNTNNFWGTFRLANEKDNFFFQSNYRKLYTDIKKSAANRISDFQDMQVENDISTNNTFNRHQFFNLTTSYTRQFEQKGKSLDLSFGYYRNSMNTANDIVQHNYLFEQAIDEYSVLQKNSSFNKNNSMNGSLRYMFPISQNEKAMIGISSNYTALSMDNDYTRFDPQNGEYIEDENKKIRQKNNQMRNRLHGSFLGMLWDINYSLSVSLENKFQENKEMVSSDNYSSNFLTLLPSISLNKKINENHSLMMRYYRSSSYPENRQLNPHADYSDSTNIEIGNPDLKPYFTNSYSAFYSYSFGEQYIGFGAYYYNSKDNIERITTQINSKTALTTYKNISSNKNFGFSLSAGQKFFDWLNIQPFISLSESKYNSQYSSNSRNRSWSGNLVTAVSFSNFKFQLYQTYSSSSMSAQEKSRSLYYANAMMKALFFNRALSLSLKVEDLFNTRNLNVDRYGTGFYSVNNVRRKTRILSLDISYYFMSKANESLEERPDGDQYGDDF